MKLSEQQFIFAKNIARLITYIFDQGYYCTVGEFLRTEEQAELYAKQGKGIRNSLHCAKLAADINLFSPDGEYLTRTEDYEKFGKYWEGLYPQNTWGGRFESRKDGNHFQQNRI